MKKKNNHNKYIALREQYPFFEYQSYSFHIKNQNLYAEFVFNLSGKYIFKPTIKILKRDFYHIDSLDEEALKSLVFHIGMVELISYWKTTCSPTVVINQHLLNKEQVDWWKKLYYNGLGEFFYLNNIQTEYSSFMDIQSKGVSLNKFSQDLNKKGAIVPVGGGKDSVVTLELLSRNIGNTIPMIINPREASVRTIETAGYRIDDSIIVERKIDQLLLDLNSEGFLNGHTPFSALLAFVSVLTAFISNHQYIALSNESSANESTVPDSDINHQYSKSFEFEKDFNWYVKNYMSDDVNYFSFLRPVNELQIAKLFSKFPDHFDGFRSCNVGSKTDIWCCKCPKCLFTYIILSPFIKKEKLASIFGKDLFNDVSLKPILNELTGRSDVKPFECVGTPDEVNSALSRLIPEISDSLLIDFTNSLNNNFNQQLSQFDEKHFIPDHLIQYLKNEIR